MPRKLRVFLCHASEDKPAVRELYQRLAAEPWIDPWLDEEDILPGQDWNLEINKATREADVIIICLSKLSVAKEGYLNKEIRRVLDIADEKLEGAIYNIPLRLDNCSPSFERLKKLHYADYFTPNAHERLLKSLRVRADGLKIETSESKMESFVETKPIVSHEDGLDLFRFIEIRPQRDSEPSYPFWIGKYPVTNAQYERFLTAHDFAEKSFWVNFQKYNENCILIGRWGVNGWDWLQEEVKKSKVGPRPRFWDNEDFGILNPDNPVVGISWYEANAYGNWLSRHWKNLTESLANTGLSIKQIRLPVDLEWTVAAGGEVPAARYPWENPWDLAFRGATDQKEILRRANINKNVGHTTPVNSYVRGASPYGVMDMAGNVWEWQANYHDEGHRLLSLRGGSWFYDRASACVSVRSKVPSTHTSGDIGFRVVIIPEA